MPRTPQTVSSAYNFIAYENNVWPLAHVGEFVHYNSSVELQELELLIRVRTVKAFMSVLQLSVHCCYVAGAWRNIENRIVVFIEIDITGCGVYLKLKQKNI